MKRIITLLLAALMLLSLCIPAFAANDTKVTALENSTIDGSTWMIEGKEDELYIYPRPVEAKDQFDIFTATITSSNDSVVGVRPGKRDTYEYGYVILSAKRVGSATVTVTDPASGASCSVKVTVLPKFLDSIHTLLVNLQTVLARIRISIASLFD